MKWLLIIWLTNGQYVIHSSYYDQKECIYVGMHLKQTSGEVHEFSCRVAKEI